MVRKRDWAGSVLVACLIALAGYLHAHSVAVVGLVAVSMVSIGVISYDAGQERGRRANPNVPAGELGKPLLIVETGNGWPWDDPRYAPTPVTTAPPLSELLESLRLDSALAPTSNPAEGYSKKFRVRNDGSVPAEECRVQSTQTASIVTLRWDVPTGETPIDLAPMEENYVVFDFSGFQYEGDYSIGLRVFAKNLDHPVEFNWAVRVAKGQYPQIFGHEG